jgi:TonB family protein
VDGALACRLYLLARWVDPASHESFGHHVGQFTQAGSDAYNALVFGHLQRFKRYPSSARGAQGVAVVRFVLNRAGAVTKSSGNDVLDREALGIDAVKLGSFAPEEEMEEFYRLHRDD